MHRVAGPVTLSLGGEGAVALFRTCAGRAICPSLMVGEMGREPGVPTVGRVASNTKCVWSCD